jgi:hypothetical protein
MILFSRWYLYHPQQAIRFQGFKTHHLCHDRKFYVLLGGVKPLKSDRGYTWLHSLVEISPFKKHHALCPEKQSGFIFSNGGHGCCFQDDISKRTPPKACSGLIFKGFAPPEPLAEYALATRKQFAKPLKIWPRPLNAIDVALKRTGVTGY